MIDLSISLNGKTLPFWNNFMEGARKDPRRVMYSNGFEHTTIFALENDMIIGERVGHIIHFETEEDATAFILKWS